MASGYQQSFIRFGIWRHTLELVAQKPFFGWGEWINSYRLSTC
ncbi:MAG: hypothetical protein ACR5LG_11105 [Sodalis sp. (in: enterobacteria)]